MELGGFNPHPGPDTCDTKAKRQELRKEVKDHGLEFSGLAADLWSQKLVSVDDSGPYIAAFAKNLFFAEDLGIDTIRVDTVEPVAEVKKLNLDAEGHLRAARRRASTCARKLAANRGIRICWEFEPGFPFNKPSEIIALVEAVRDRGNPNFGVLYDTCHAHMCAAVGANQIGEKETLPGGEVELLHKLKGQDHSRPPDRLGRLAERAQYQHAQSVRHGQAELRQTHSRAVDRPACPTIGGAWICASGPTPGT